MKHLSPLICALFLASSVCAYEKIVLSTDPGVLSIPIQDNHEEMIDLALQNDIAFGPSPEIPNNANYTKIRKTIYEKLKQAQKQLPKGLRLCVYEGYRSLGLQQTLFRKRFHQLQNFHAKLSYEEIFLKTTQMFAPVTNIDGTQNVPAPATGAAIAIYLINEKGLPVDMGIMPQDWTRDRDGTLSAMHSPKISEQAQYYRKVMANALRSVGFVNYPSAYWHWSYGDRYWAYQTHHDHALYDVLTENTQS